MCGLQWQSLEQWTVEYSVSIEVTYQGWTFVCEKQIHCVSSSLTSKFQEINQQQFVCFPQLITCNYCSVPLKNHDIHIYDPGSRFATTPPPHGMVPQPAFCSSPHENVVFAVFFAWWVAGAVRNPANSLDFCNQPSENVLFAMFRLRHRGVVPPRSLLFLCQIIILFSIFY